MWPISFEPVPDRRSQRALPTLRGVASILAAFAVGLLWVAGVRDAGADCTIDTPCKIAANEADTAGCLVVGIPQETGILWLQQLPAHLALSFSELGRDARPTTTEVDTSGVPITGFSLAFDASRQPVIAFGTARGLAIATRMGGPGQPFTRMDLDREASQVTSLSGVRTSTGVAVAYCDVARGCLKYSERTAKGWKTAVVDRAHAANGVSLVASGSARAIAYYDPANGDLRVARRRNGVWSSRVVDSVGDVGLSPSMVGNPATSRLGIAYCDRKGVLKYASTQAGAWTVRSVKTDGKVGRSCAAIAYGRSVVDSIAVAYYDRTHDRLALAEKLGTWGRSLLDPVAGSGVAVSAAPLSRGVAHFAYVRSNGDLFYLKRTIGEGRSDAEEASR